MERLKWIDFLRGIAMIAILAFHTEVYYKEYNISPYYLYTTNAIILFYIISGYLFYRTPAIDSRKKIKNIARQLLMPYFIFTSLIYVPKLLIRNETVDYQQIIVNILLGRASWFIAALIIAEMAFVLLLRITSAQHKWLLPLSIFCFIIYFVIPYNQYNYWQWQDALLSVFFLYIGYTLNQYQHYFKSLDRPVYTLLLSITIIILKIYEYHIDPPTLNIAINQPLLFFIDSTVWVLLIISLVRHIPSCSIIEWTGQHCIVYYFLAGGCPLITSMVMNKIGFTYNDNSAHYFFTLLLVYLMATVITYGIYKYFPFITGKTI